eukprot:1018049-Amorphochlora_amoeboformis.AAC.1
MRSVVVALSIPAPLSSDLNMLNLRILTITLPYSSNPNPNPNPNANPNPYRTPKELGEIEGSISSSCGEKERKRIRRKKEGKKES